MRQAFPPAALLLLLLLTAPLLPACGGGGGGVGTPGSVLRPPDPPAAPASRAATVLFVDPDVAPGAPVVRAAAPPPEVTVGSRRYAANDQGLVSAIPVLPGEELRVDEIRWSPFPDPASPADESLLVKAVRPAGGPTAYAAAVLHRPAANGGLMLRAETRSASTDAVRLFAPETAADGMPITLLSDYLTRVEADAARALQIAPPARDNAALFQALPGTYAVALSGELTLVIDPEQSSLAYGESRLLTLYRRDARGVRAQITTTGWSADPPGIVDVDIRGRVTARTVPGIVTITARYENMFATAEVTVLSAEEGTALAGTLAADTTLVPGTLYTVTGDLLIPAGRTLRVPGGTTVRFLAGADGTSAGENPNLSELIVAGTLEVTGLETQNAILRSTNTRNPTHADWFGIRVVRGGTARLDRVRITDAVYGAKCDGGALAMTRTRVWRSQIGVSANDLASVHLERNEITGCIIGVEYRRIPFGAILRNFIADNSQTGINLYESDPVVYGNILARHPDCALGIYRNAFPIVKNNLFIAATQCGIRVGVAVRPQIKWNVIAHCPAFGVLLQERTRTELRNNIFLANYTALGFGDRSRLLFGHNAFFRSEFANFFNFDPGRRNDQYLGLDDIGTPDPNPAVVAITGTLPVSLSLFPGIHYGDPRFVRPNYDHPNLGDFALGPTSPFRALGENTGPIGLIDPVDLGTASVRVGDPLF